MIKTVIFDVGGVLIRTEDRTPRRKLEQRLGLQPGESEVLVFNEEMGNAAQLGEITSAELWGWVRQKLGLDDAEVAQFQQEFFGGDRLNTPLMAYIRSLRPAYQTAIISNASDNLNRVISELYPIADAFDLVVGSAYERVMKPDAEIFKRTLSRLGRRAEETVFVDDFAHNVDAARALGMHAVHYTPATDIPAAFAQLGVVPPG